MSKIASIVDSHTHSLFSGDSKMPIIDGVRKALEVGLAGISLTDHLELGHPIARYSMSFDVAERSRQILQLQQQFEGRLKILKGIEVGFQPHIAADARDVIKKNDFDFVICSTHIVDRMDEKRFYTENTKQRAYTRYLESIYEAVTSFDEWDIVGHIGYVCRYAPYKDPSLRYIDYADILDAILKKTVESGRGIEINTGGYFYELGYTHPDIDVLTRYKELGGSIITVGSDAHSAGRIGDRFEKVLQLLKDCGFSYVAHFENRKPIMVKI